MPNARDLIDEFLEIHNIKKLNPSHYSELKYWLQELFQKRMDRPLFVTLGKGGGQRYRLWWIVYSVLGNKNKPCYFYTDMEGITSENLIKNGHLPLQHWIDDDSPQLKYNP